jgi:hypothetical protein
MSDDELGVIGALALIGVSGWILLHFAIAELVGAPVWVAVAAFGEMVLSALAGISAVIWRSMVKRRADRD